MREGSGYSKNADGRSSNYKACKANLRAALQLRSYGNQWCGILFRCLKSLKHGFFVLVVNGKSIFNMKR